MRIVFPSELAPRDVLNHFSLKQMKQAGVLVSNPEVPRRNFSYRMYRSAGNIAYGNEFVILYVSELLICGDPDSSAAVLKKRVGWLSSEFSVRLPRTHAAAEHRYLSVLPCV